MFRPQVVGLRAMRQRVRSAVERGERERDGLRADYATADSVFAPDPEIEVELLTGGPQPQGFCADGRMVAKIEKVALPWVLYWTITTTRRSATATSHRGRR